MSKKRKDRKKKRKSKPSVGSIRNSFGNIGGSKVPFANSPVNPEVAPEGFRPISMSQAMIEYSKPLMDLASTQGIKDINETMQLSMISWNYSLASERGGLDEKTKSTVIDCFTKILKIRQNEAEEILANLLERKAYLFPSEIQPRFFPTTMFIRKEETHQINPLNCNEINLNEQIIPPDQEDEKLIQDIRKLDLYVMEDVEYDEWENLYLTMEDDCVSRFQHWLQQKGWAEKLPDIAFCIGPYLNFIYRYMDGPREILRDVSPLKIDAFLNEHLLRKVMVDPHEYPWWISAIKLFYIFLYEKKYLSEEPKSFVKNLDDIEPRFIEFLRGHFN